MQASPNYSHAEATDREATARPKKREGIDTAAGIIRSSQAAESISGNNMLQNINTCF